MHTSRLLPIIGFAALLTLTGCDLFGSETDTPQDEEAEQQEGMNMTFAELMALGENYTCTFTDVDTAGGTTNGVVYVESGAGNMRGEFTMMEADGTTSESNVIRVGDKSYLWGSELEQGIVMTIPPEDDSAFGMDEHDGDDTGFSEDEPVDFDCEPWSPDDDMFEPPADVEFMDMGAHMGRMMEQMDLQMPEGSPSTPPIDAMEDKCALCAQIPDGDAKEQCLRAVGC